MRLYIIAEPMLEDIQWAGTLKEAQARVNEAEPVFRSTNVVYEVEYPTDKPGSLAWLNKGWTALKKVRKWHGTARGGLKEVALPPEPEEVATTEGDGSAG
jgi:hypothetical protein